MGLILTPLFIDNFIRANEDPLNPAKWTEVGGLDLSVLGNLCVVGTISGLALGQENYSGSVLPNDQFASAVIGAIVLDDPASMVQVWVRTDGTNGNGYVLVYGFDGVSATTLTLTVEPSEAWAETFVIPSPSVDDVMTIAAVGSTIYMLYNGAIVGSHIDTSRVSGSPLLAMAYSSVRTDTAVSKFTTGSAIFIPPAVPIPFSRRTTASTAVFSCIFIASPQGAQTLSPSVPNLSALALEYAQLVNLYPQLIHQDVANQQTVLTAAITSAITIVTALSATLQSMTATGDAAFILNGFRIVAANALTNLNAALAAGTE